MDEYEVVEGATRVVKDLLKKRKALIDEGFWHADSRYAMSLLGASECIGDLLSIMLSQAEENAKLKEIVETAKDKLNRPFSKHDDAHRCRFRIEAEAVLQSINARE